MTEPAQLPKRPLVLIIALVLLPLAALLFAMTVQSLTGSAGRSNGPHSIAWVFCLLAIRFNWARITSVVLLAFLALQWAPGGFVNLGDPDVSQAASYAVIGTVFFVAGTVLVFLAPSNQYYRQAKRWRQDRRRRKHAKI